MQLPFISIIVPMYNSEATIERCITSLLALDFPSENLEIIIVDNQSTDQSLRITKKYPVETIESSGNTIAEVRNNGARLAKGDIFAFVDSDCLVHKAWIKNALDYLDDSSVAVTGSGHLCPERYSWVEKAWLYESKHKPFEAKFIPSGNCFIKANVFREVNGFDVTLTTCEDADICERILKANYKIINASNLMIIHLENPKTIFNFFKKELWYGKSMLSASNNKVIDKTMVMTLFFLFTHLGLFYGIINLFLTGSYNMLSYSLSIIIFITLISALYRLKRSKKYSLLLHIIYLYYFYLLARSIGIIFSIQTRFKKYIRIPYGKF